MKEIILENNNLDLKNGDFYVFNLIKKNNTYIVEKVLLKDNKIKILFYYECNNMEESYSIYKNITTKLDLF
ncbi:unknown [Clostridium sp. CAG:433]|jgi:hypothetical protein|nr:unknown [Clostridium sp. CAG:433]